MDKLYQSLKNISISHKFFQNLEGGNTLYDRDQRSRATNSDIK